MQLKFYRDLFNKYKNKYNSFFLFFFFIILTTLIGFNGYLNPFTIRSFGDISPNLLLSDDVFQFFNINFFESFSPNFNAPYRYRIEQLSFYLQSIWGLSKYNIDWIFLFFPYLISTVLSSLFFHSLTKNKIIAFVGWFFYTFSTFTLFTSSIHTPIITAINCVLFYFYLTNIWLKGKNKISNTILYIISSTGILIIGCFFDMRMIVITIPLIIFINIINILILNQKSYVVLYKSLCHILITQIIIAAIVVSNFIYIFINLKLIFQSASQLTTRSTWGNNYFQIINVLSLSHPFWNNGRAENFLYNFPSGIHLLNVILFIILISSLLFYRKKLKWWLVLVLPLLFSLFLSKQNNFPFENIYDILYQYPYFNLSREASKYYYSFLILWTTLLTVLLNELYVNKKKWLLRVLVGLAMIPVLFNFIIFSSGKYENSTIAYPYNTIVYNEINASITKDMKNNINTENRVLWLPLMGSLQDNTTEIKHLSYNTLINLYPLSNVRKETRSYMYESLGDDNFQKYIQLMGFQYVVIPDINNEPSINSQMFINYDDFNMVNFTKYAENKLPIKLIFEMNNYKLYKLDWNENLSKYNKVDLNVVNSFIPPPYLNIGDIDFNTERRELEKYNTIRGVEESLGNCNSNPAKKLDFNPQDRIKINRNDSIFDLELEAKKEEIPCVTFNINIPKENKPEDLYLKLNKFQGSNIEVIIFWQNFPQRLEIKQFLNINNISDYIPLNCPTYDCNLKIYLKGSTAKLAQSELQFEFITTQTPSIDLKEGKIGIFTKPINNLNKTIISQSHILSSKSSSGDINYVLFRYQYDDGYVLVQKDGEVLKPQKNNHNLLIFNVKGKDLTGSYLQYLPQQTIQKSLEITDKINFITILAFVISICYASYTLITNKLRKSKQQKDGNINQITTALEKKPATTPRQLVDYNDY
jgi:hypothetical protein